MKKMMTLFNPLNHCYLTRTGRRRNRRPLWLSTPVLHGILPAVCALLFIPLDTRAGRPRVLTTAAERSEIRERIRQCESTAALYNELKERVRPFVERHVDDPEWIVSRMPMNWETHYTTDLIKDQAWHDGEGRAPVPTPRYEGLRRHLGTTHSLPTNPDDFAELRPYADKGGLIWARNNSTGDWEWAEPKETRHSIGGLHLSMMRLAQDAAFVYWLEGKNASAYADFAGDILWTYMHGFSYKKEPRVIDDDSYQKRVLGMNRLQTVHEHIVRNISITYDYLHDHLRRRERDTHLIELQIKRMIDKVIENGLKGGNWDISQALTISHGAMALDDNDAYEDGRGRPYYIDIALNADLPRQTGLIVHLDDFCSETALWPELGGYGLGMPSALMRIASILSNDPAAAEVMSHPIFFRNIFAQLELRMHPRGHNPRIGVSGGFSLRTDAVERQLAWALEQDDGETAAKLAAVLRHEIEAGRYEREPPSGIDGIVRPLKELPESPPLEEVWQLSATYYAVPFNLVMMRSLPKDGNIDHALSGTLYGSKGGHHHAQGLSIDLFGAGQTLGVDPGIRGSRHSEEHSEYFSKTPAHNTVIVNGRSGQRNLPMKIRSLHPSIGKDSGSEQAASEVDFLYAQGELSYDDPAASQQRTLALARVDGETAFFFDVFRSRLDEPDSDEYHDYLYQNRSDRMEITDETGQPLPLEESGLLTSNEGNLVGYDYFRNERSALHDGPILVSWPWKPDEGGEVVMDLFMPEGEDRQVFRVDAPNTRGFSGPLRKLIVRQRGEAWERPFAAVYAPRHADQAPTVRGIEALGDDSWRIYGYDWSAKLTLVGSRLHGSYEKTVRE